MIAQMNQEREVLAQLVCFLTRLCDEARHVRARSHKPQMQHDLHSLHNQLPLDGPSCDVLHPHLHHRREVSQSEELLHRKEGKLKDHLHKPGKPCDEHPLKELRFCVVFHHKADRS